MGNYLVLPMDLRFRASSRVQEYRAAAPPQQIILDPDARSSMNAVDLRSNDEEPSQLRSISHTSLGEVKAVGVAIAVRKSSLFMEPIQNEQFLISFEYTSKGPATVKFLFQQVHQGLTHGIPSFSKPQITLGPVHLPVGERLKYVMDPALLKNHPSLTLSSCSFTKERSFVPILLLFESKVTDYVLYIMAGLAWNDCNASWDFIVTKQRVKQGNTGYQIQEIYGLNTSALKKEQQEAVHTDEDETTRRCVVCLTNTTDTFVMPCRHMCLCSVCASTMSKQYQLCPICRGPISHIVSIPQMDAQ